MIDFEKDLDERIDPVKIAEDLFPSRSHIDSLPDVYHKLSSARTIEAIEALQRGVQIRALQGINNSIALLSSIDPNTVIPYLPIVWHPYANGDGLPWMGHKKRVIAIKESISLKDDYLYPEIDYDFDGYDELTLKGPYSDKSVFIVRLDVENPQMWIVTASGMSIKKESAPNKYSMEHFPYWLQLIEYGRRNGLTNEAFHKVINGLVNPFAYESGHLSKSIYKNGEMYIGVYTLDEEFVFMKIPDSLENGKGAYEALDDELVFIKDAEGRMLSEGLPSSYGDSSGIGYGHILAKEDVDFLWSNIKRTICDSRGPACEASDDINVENITEQEKTFASVKCRPLVNKFDPILSSAQTVVSDKIVIPEKNQWSSLVKIEVLSSKSIKLINDDGSELGSVQEIIDAAFPGYSSTVSYKSFLALYESRIIYGSLTRPVRIAFFGEGDVERKGQADTAESVLVEAGEYAYIQFRKKTYKRKSIEATLYDLFNTSEKNKIIPILKTIFPPNLNIKINYLSNIPFHKYLPPLEYTEKPFNRPLGKTPIEVMHNPQHLPHTPILF